MPSVLIFSCSLDRVQFIKNLILADMKTIAVFIALVAMAAAAPQFQQTNYRDIYVVRETPSNNIGLDGYQFGYELSDGQKRDESASFEPRGLEDGILRVTGSYSYVGPDGQTYTVNYVADENGFHATGDHIPQPIV